MNKFIYIKSEDITINVNGIVMIRKESYYFCKYMLVIIGWDGVRTQIQCHSEKGRLNMIQKIMNFGGNKFIYMKNNDITAINIDYVLYILKEQSGKNNFQLRITFKIKYNNKYIINFSFKSKKDREEILSKITKPTNSIAI